MRLGGAGRGKLETLSSNSSFIICLTQIPRIANSPTHPGSKVSTKVPSRQGPELSFCFQASGSVSAWTVELVGLHWLWNCDCTSSAAPLCFFPPPLKGPVLPKWPEWESRVLCLGRGSRSLPRTASHRGRSSSDPSRVMVNGNVV